MNRNEIFHAAQPLIADRLAIKPQDVTMASRLIDDLGADSLDLLDIVFGLEKLFGIKMRDGELDFLTRLDFSSPEVMREGYLTAQTIDQLKTWLPDLRAVADSSKVTPRQLFSFITIEALCALLEKRLQ
jgi:acyl carrier protein